VQDELCRVLNSLQEVVVWNPELSKADFSGVLNVLNTPTCVLFASLTSIIEAIFRASLMSSVLIRGHFCVHAEDMSSTWMLLN
jgi:hypothetical protein